MPIVDVSTTSRRDLYIVKRREHSHKDCVAGREIIG